MAVFYYTLLIKDSDLERKLNGQASKQGRVEWAMLCTQAISAPVLNSLAAETFKAQLLSSQQLSIL